MTTIKDISQEEANHDPLATKQIVEDGTGTRHQMYGPMIDNTAERNRKQRDDERMKDAKDAKDEGVEDYTPPDTLNLETPAGEPPNEEPPAEEPPAKVPPIEEPPAACNQS